MKNKSRCILYGGALDKDGYARSHGRYLHRVWYEREHGPIPKGLTLDHLCRVRNCINPKHLEPVTMRENLMRGQTQARFKAEQTACVRGHQFDERNTGFKYPPSHPNGMRYCKTCDARCSKERRARKRAA